MIIFAWILLLGEWRILSRLYLPSCILIFLAISAPWHILVQQHNPEFFYFYFIEQHFLRYTTKDIGHYQPMWFFIPYLILGFFPWIIFLPQAIANQIPSSWQKRSEYKFALFFLLWAFLIFVFFSCSKSKLIPYILPVFPPFAILIARYLQQSIAAQRYRGIKWGYLSLLILASVLAISLNFTTHLMIVPDPIKGQWVLTMASLILMIGAFVACYYAFRHNKKAVIITIASSWLFLLTTLAAIPYIETRTIAPLAMRLKPILKPQDDIIAYNQYYQDLPFYLERKISILNWRNELNFGMQHQTNHEWMLDDASFWQAWHSPQRIFVMMDSREYDNFHQLNPDEKTFLFAKSIHNVLMSNHPN